MGTFIAYTLLFPVLIIVLTLTTLSGVSYDDSTNSRYKKIIDWVGLLSIPNYIINAILTIINKGGNVWYPIIKKEYLGVFYDRYTKSEPDDAVVIQGLIGRATGYDDNGKSIIFTNLPSIEKYDDLWNSKF